MPDRAWILPYIAAENTNNADFSFLNLYAWGDTFNASAAVIGGCLVISTVVDGVQAFSWPLGTGGSREKLKGVIEELLAATSSNDFRLTSLPQYGVAALEELYSGKFAFYPQVDFFDYVYSAEKLLDLGGKKLHAKRNYINRFIKEHNWSYEPVSRDNLGECAELLLEWNSDEHAEDEAAALQKTFRDFEALELDGGLLRVDGFAAAFALGERLSADTYVVHFEKAKAEIEGAYAMINREFVRHIKSIFPDMLYINREDDMGLPNLRKAKRSYYPDLMVEKFAAVLN